MTDEDYDVIAKKWNEFTSDKANYEHLYALLGQRAAIVVQKAFNAGFEAGLQRGLEKTNGTA